METNNHIDQILQKGLEHFEPTPPAEAWDFIEQQIQVNPASSSVGSTNQLVQAIKGLSIGAKLAAVLSVPAILGAIYFFTSSSNTAIGKKELLSTFNESNVKVNPTSPSISAPETVLQSKSEGENQQVKTSVKPLQAKAEPIQKPEMPKDVIPSSDLPTQVVPIAPKPSSAEPNKIVKEDKNKYQEVQIIKHAKPEKPENSNSNNTTLEPEFGNAFSPNGDGKNDTWEIRLENASYFHLKIFDTNGQLVFETEQVDHFWNGTNMKTGVDCEDGQYVFVLDYQINKAENSRTKGGFINLVR